MHMMLGELVLDLIALLMLAVVTVGCFIWSILELKKMAQKEREEKKLNDSFHAASLPEQKSTS